VTFPVKGENVTVGFKIGDDFYDVLCGVDCDFTNEVELIPITGPTSSTFEEIMPRKEKWAVTVNGVTKIENDTALTFFYLLQTSVRRQRQTIRMTFTDEDGDSKQIEGNVYIGNSNISGPISDYANSNIEFRGTGPYVISESISPEPEEFEILSDSWDTVNGDNFITGASSGNYTGTAYTLTTDDIILEVRMEGTNYEVVSGTPSNGERQCQFTTGPVRIQFPAALVFDGTQKVFVMFKRPI
jgi:hypothetical protein